MVNDKKRKIDMIDNKKYRIKEMNKYNGSKQSKERLCNLFYIMKLNINDYTNIGSNYVKYLTEIFNDIRYDMNKANIDNYNVIFERIFKITEINNIGNLNRLLFNVLVSLDAFNDYISSELNNVSHNELKDFVLFYNNLMNAKIIETNINISLKDLIAETRNTIIHSGKYVTQFTLLPSDDKKNYVPGLSIPLKQIYNEQFFRDYNLPDDLVIDTIEVFRIFNDNIPKLEELLKPIITKAS